jgi:hypothetical protein
VYIMEKYITGTDQTVWVHEKDVCEGRNCCIHNPSDHHMVDWPTHWGEDRKLMERLCKCGVGHPDPDYLAHKESLGIKHAGVHGCCGCCVPPKKDEGI